MSAVTDGTSVTSVACDSRNGPNGQTVTIPGYAPTGASGAVTEPEQLHLDGLVPPNEGMDYETVISMIRTGRPPVREYALTIDDVTFGPLSIGTDDEGRVWGATFAAAWDEVTARDRVERREARRRERDERLTAARERIHRFREGRVTDGVAAARERLEAVATPAEAIAWLESVPKRTKRTKGPASAYYVSLSADGRKAHTDEPCGYCAHTIPYWRSMCDEHLIKVFVREATECLWECRACGRAYLSRSHWDPPARVGFCSDDCGAVTQSERAKIRRSESRNALDLRCQTCDEPLDADRADARYCSPACRQRAYRMRKKEER